MIDEVLLEAEEKMEKTVTNFEKKIGKVRTGRASPAMLDSVTVEYYGAPTPLNQIAGISVSEGRQLVIKAYDKSSLKDIERGIYEADLGLTPQNDGKVIRVNVPPLTEDRRKELVKQVEKMAEEDKVALRNIRRSANDQVKKNADNEDEEKEGKDEVQDLIKKYTKQIEDITKEKEKDLMTV